MTAETAETGLRVLQRVVFPTGNLDVVPLYVETNLERGAAELASERLTQTLGKKTATTTTATSMIANAAAATTQSSIRFDAALPPHLAQEVEPRRSAEIAADQRVSFGTYFNAFPASYWRRWTTIDSVTLRIRVAGEATVFLYRSNARGLSHPVETIPVTTTDPQTIERTLPLAPFIDGGWYWFDIVAGPRGTALLEGEWLAATDHQRQGRVSIGITTFNLPDFMVDQLRTLGDSPGLLELVDKIYVVDQGTNRLRDHPDYADAAKKVADHLVVIEQGNLGGAGGFSRAMAETLRSAESDYLLIMDDDITLDPEGIIRAVTFADLARRPTIVGGHMFSLHDRAQLHAFAESVAQWKWWWGPAPNTKHRHDFGSRNLRNTPWLHRRVDADYNGWWMCLIPRSIIEEIGLALPVFIKWDDAEYGLRARQHGYPTVSMPGVAAWHVPWQDKNDAHDWQAYYHVRNRVITALLHSPYDHGGALVSESAETQVQHLLSMQYSTAALRVLALEDILSGPDHLHRDLLSKMAQLRAVRQQYTDAQPKPDVEDFPPVRRRKPPSRGRDATSPTNRFGLVTKAALAAAKQLTVPRKTNRRPLVALSYQDASWWRLSSLDSALVSSADGKTTAWYQRDPQQFRALTQRSIRLHAQLMRKWPKLSAQYREAAEHFTSPEAWWATFESSVDDPPSGP